jgi:hypothetical protein
MNGLDKAALDRWITREQPKPDDEAFYKEDEPISPHGPCWFCLHILKRQGAHA